MQSLSLQGQRRETKDFLDATSTACLLPLGFVIRVILLVASIYIYQWTFVCVDIIKYHCIVEC